MKKNKKVIIGAVIAIIVVVAVCIGLVVMQVNKVKQEQELIAEINRVTEAADAYSEIDMTIKTTGKYAVVEKAIKEYLTEAQDLMKTAEETYKNESIINSLTPENLKNDGPEFTATKEQIATARENANTSVSKLTTMLDEQTMLAKIENENLSDYYVTIYKKLMYEDEQTMQELKDVQGQLTEANTMYIGMLDKIEQIITLLSQNPNSWSVNDYDQVEFTSQSILDQYNGLVEEIQDLAQEAQALQ